MLRAITLFLFYRNGHYVLRLFAEKFFRYNLRDFIVKAITVAAWSAKAERGRGEGERVALEALFIELLVRIRRLIAI